MAFPTVSLEVAFNYDPLASYFDTVMGDNPAGYWRFDEPSGNPQDISGNANHFNSITGGTRQFTGLLASDANTCIDWAGSGSNGGNWTTTGDLEFWETKSFTFECLFNTDVNNSTKQIFIGGRSTTGGVTVDQIDIYLNSSGNLVFRCKRNDTAAWVTATGTTAIQLSTTYHLMCICSLTGTAPNEAIALTIMLNGNVEATASASSINGMWDDPVLYAANMTVCHDGVSFPWNGRMDEVAWYPTALDPVRAALHYAAASSSNTPTWTDLTNDTIKRGVEITTKRGRQSQKDTIEPGVLNARLRNHDRALDPTNASSAYYPDVIPVRKVRLKVVYNSTTYYVFTGDAENWKQVWNARENCLDLSVVEALSALEYNELTNVDRPVEKAGARINKLLGLSGIPNADRSVDTGSFNLQALTDASGSVDQLITNCIEADGGIFFMSGAGVFTFHDYAHRDKYGVLLSLSNAQPPSSGFLPFIESSVETRPDRIKNKLTYTKEGDAATYTTVYDIDSIKKFRTRTDNKTIALNSGADITTRVGQVLKDSAWPWPAPEYIIVNPGMDDNLWEHVLNREISDRLMLEIQPPGGGSPYYTQAIIEGIEHTIEPPTFWRTVWRLSKPQTLRVGDTGTGTDSGVKV